MGVCSETSSGRADPNVRSRKNMAWLRLGFVIAGFVLAALGRAVGGRYRPPLAKPAFDKIAGGQRLLYKPAMS